MVKMLPLPQVREATGLGTTSIYCRVKSGVFVPPVKVTPRSSRWLDHEVGAINAAVAAGASEADLRALVTKLIAARKDALAHITSNAAVAA